jgi:small-conductance mechanosensitive channel
MNSIARFTVAIVSLVVLLILFVLTAVPAMTAEQKGSKPLATTAPAQTPAPATDSASIPSGLTAIPVIDVATKAAEMSNLLRTFNDKLTLSAQIDTIRKSLPEATVQVDQALADTMQVLQRQPALPTLQTQQQQWQQMQRMYAGWLAVLMKRSNELQDDQNRLNDLQKKWAMTLDAAKASKAHGPSLQQINETIASIRAAQDPLNEQLTLVIDLQSRVGNEVKKCEKILAEIARIQQASMSGILVQDSLPVWSPKLWADALNALPEHVRSTAATYWTDVGNYLNDPFRRLPLHTGILAVLTLLFLGARYQIRRWTAAGETFSDVIQVFDHPVAASLTLALLFATSPYWLPLPATVRDTFQVLALVPMIILIRPVVSERLVPGLYALGLLFAIDAIRGIFSGEELIGQVSLILESLTGMAVVIWFLRNLPQAFGEAAGSSRLRVLQSGSVLILLILTSSFAAAAMGYVRFARIITPGIIAGGVLALTLYASLRVLIGIVAIAFHIWPLRSLRMIQHHRNKMESRFYRFLVWAVIAGLIVRYLSYIGLLAPVLTFGKTVLNTKLERGVFSISPGDILEFVLMVWAAYLLSAFIRFVLREDVYPRLRIAQGKSYAVSSLLHYFILALGFTAAIAAMGVNLAKLTVLTGAFGIGIGFGLQSVVNNFVSGLILFFERPIHVGDTVEVGDLLGEVRRIGIRASTVHTRQGADIIVPNSQLVTEKVTNWTLSDQLRRIDLPVGVSYSSAPNEVIKVLEGVAVAHPQILRDPAPLALFVGYGDSSINFELRAWTAQFDDWPQIRSALAVAVYDAVRAAGMTFPFPQREVRLLKDSKGGDSVAAKAN